MLHLVSSFLLCCTDILKVNSQPTKLSVQYTEKNITFCEVEAHHSFYVYNPLARLLIENRYDCILACSYHRLCEASNFVTEANLCFLHGSKPKRMKQVIGSNLVPSVLSILYCGKDTAPSIDQAAGIPAETCGISHFPAGDSTSDGHHRFRRILGGFISRPYAYPWTGVVIRNNFRICSLFLVTRNQNDKSTKWGVSAAHCFRDKKYSVEDFGFLFGIHDLRLSLPYTIYRRANSIVLHPKFTGLFNDIALIKFDRKIAFNFYIRPICLPEKPEIKVSSMNACMFCGWGSTNSEDPGACAHILECIDSSTIKSNMRLISWTLDRKSSIASIWKSASPKGPFHVRSGDSGSPLFCYKDGRYVAQGVISDGDRMIGESRVLSTKLSHYLTWILDTINDNSNTASVGWKSETKNV